MSAALGPIQQPPDHDLFYAERRLFDAYKELAEIGRERDPTEPNPQHGERFHVKG